MKLVNAKHEQFNLKKLLIKCFARDVLFIKFRRVCYNIAHECY